MKMNKSNGYSFDSRYQDAVRELANELDKFIHGKWYEYDYLQAKVRTLILRDYDEDGFLIAYFGDKNSKDKTSLFIEYKEIDNEIIIVDIQFNKTNKVYSQDIKSLIGYRIKGKINEELDLLRMGELERTYGVILKSIESLETDLANKREFAENTLNEINKIKNNIGK